MDLRLPAFVPPSTAVAPWLALVLLSGCTGGQSGDEGLGNHQGDRSGGGGPFGPFSCEQEVWVDFEVPPRTDHCRLADPDAVDVGAWRESGDVADSPAGEYACECDGAMRTIVSDGCVEAIELACGIELGEPGFCSRDAATCARADLSAAGADAGGGDPGAFQCRCTFDGPVAPVAADSCDDALYAGCPPFCEDDHGRCDALQGESGFACGCEDGSELEWTGTRDCQCALWACAPNCESAAGACYQRQDGLLCRCADGSETRLLGDEAAGGCYLALEEHCGFPAAGEDCEDRVSDTLVHRCEADGQGDWICDCPGAEARASDGATTGGGRIGSAGQSRCGTPEPPTLVDGRPLTCTQAMLLYCGD